MASARDVLSTFANLLMVAVPFLGRICFIHCHSIPRSVVSAGLLLETVARGLAGVADVRGRSHGGGGSGGGSRSRWWEWK